MSEDNKEQPLRINKYLTLSGVESRRVADDLITQGRVSINGTVVDQPGVKVQPGDSVRLDDKRVEPLPITSILLNKPRGFICSRVQQGETDTIYTLLPPNLQHLTYAGRLDSDSEGLVIMSNDGDLIQKVTHPTEGIEKEYWVTLDQSFDNSVLTQLLRGVTIPEGFAKAKYVMRASSRRAHVVLEQGMKRQVRQMFSCLGLRVSKLVRVRIGSLWGGDLEPGRWSKLTDSDIQLALKNPPPSKDWYSPAVFPKLEKYKPGRLGGPLHPGQIAERRSGEEGERRGVREFSTRDGGDRRPRFNRDENSGRPFRGREDRGFDRGFGGDRGFDRNRSDRGDRGGWNNRSEGRGGFGGRREGGFGRDRDDFRGRRDFGGRDFRPDRGHGDDSGRGGFRSEGRSDFKPRRDFDRGGFGGRREGGFDRGGRDDFRPRRDFGNRDFRSDRGHGNDSGRGGFRSEGRPDFKPRRDFDRGGFGGRREGGFGRDRDGGGFRGGRNSGGFKPRDNRGGFGGGGKRFDRGDR